MAGRQIDAARGGADHSELRTQMPGGRCVRRHSAQSPTITLARRSGKSSPVSSSSRRTGRGS